MPFPVWRGKWKALKAHFGPDNSIYISTLESVMTYPWLQAARIMTLIRKKLHQPIGYSIIGYFTGFVVFCATKAQNNWKKLLREIDQKLRTVSGKEKSEDPPMTVTRTGDKAVWFPIDLWVFCWLTFYWFMLEFSVISTFTNNIIFSCPPISDL